MSKWAQWLLATMIASFLMTVGLQPVLGQSADLVAAKPAPIGLKFGAFAQSSLEDYEVKRQVEPATWGIYHHVAEPLNADLMKLLKEKNIRLRVVVEHLTVDLGIQNSHPGDPPLKAGASFDQLLEKNSPVVEMHRARARQLKAADVEADVVFFEKYNDLYSTVSFYKNDGFGSYTEEALRKGRQAFKILADVYHQEGGPKVRVLLSLIDIQPKSIKLEEFAPDPATFEAVEVVGYNWAEIWKIDWKVPGEVFNYSLAELARALPGKPVILRAACTEKNGLPATGPAILEKSKANWIVQLGQLARFHKEVEEVTWIDQLLSDGKSDWTLDSSPEAAAAWHQISKEQRLVNRFGI